MSFRVALIASIALLALLVNSSTQAQVVETWSRSFAPSVYLDLPTDIVVDAQGNTTVVGAEQTSDDSHPPATASGFVVRYDSQGTLQWTRYYSTGPFRRTSFVAAAAAPSGGIVACGSTSSTQGAQVLNIVVVSYDANGTMLWSATYGTPGGGHEQSYAMAVEPAGDVWVVGVTAADWLVLKYSASGALLWTTTLNGSANGDDYPFAIALDGQGGAYVTGQQSYNFNANSDVESAHFDGAGNLLWVREYSGTGSGYSYGWHVAVDSAGDAYIAGQTRQGSVDAFTLMKYDASGTLQWVSAASDPVGGHSQGLAKRTVVDEDGKIAVAGTYYPSGGESDALIEKYDAAGNQLWAQTFDGATHRDDAATQLAIDATGEIFVAGTTSVMPSGPEILNALFLRLDSSSGAQRWEGTWASPSVNGLAVGPSGAVFATSIGSGPYGGYDTAVLTNRFDSTSSAFCFGDGTGTACPCGNTSAVGNREGCRSSLGYGSTLRDGGSASLSADSLQLNADQMSLSASALFFQGDAAIANGAGVVFGDGLRCAGGSIVRLATRTSVSGGATFPKGLDPSVSVRGQVTSPGMHTYQVWYRNAAAFCTSATYNLTNGLRVTWVP